ncbi:MAG: response regulator [Colwellia sp.]|nr:response regulator [Colwellia sp.]
MRNIKYLVVDDCPTVIKIVRKAIKYKIGAEQIFSASNGIEAMSLLRQEEIDIVISDWEMPEMSGKELLHQMQIHSKYKEIPFIMMSTKGDKNHVLAAIRSGACNYLIKPFTPDNLDVAIRKSWNGSNKRKSTRHTGLPIHQSKISDNDFSVPVELLNISRTGALIRLPYSDKIKLFDWFDFTLTFEGIELLDDICIESLPCSPLRIYSDGKSDNNVRTCEVGLSFETKNINLQAEKQLIELLETLSTFGQEHIKAT